MLDPRETECPTCNAAIGAECVEPRLPADGVHLTRKSRAKALGNSETAKRVSEGVKVYHVSRGERPRWSQDNGPSEAQVRVLRAKGKAIPKTRREAAAIIETMRRWDLKPKDSAPITPGAR